MAPPGVPPIGGLEGAGKGAIGGIYVFGITAEIIIPITAEVRMENQQLRALQRQVSTI